MASFNTQTQDFIVVEGMDHKDFFNFINKVKRDFDKDKDQLFILVAPDNINIELFCSKDGKIYVGAEALYKIARTEYDKDKVEEIDF